MGPLRQPGTIAAVLCASIVSGCASIEVRSFTERGTDFSRYHTYNWAADGQQPTGDPRLDNNPFFQARVQADVDEQLSKRGFEKVTSGTPDLVLRYYAKVDQRLEVSNAYCVDCKPSVYDAGTLLIDLVDARSNNLVWRGWAEGSIDGAIDNQLWLEEKVDEAVRLILERLPRRL
jgi:Domain of unknown function (DUF4136)